MIKRIPTTVLLSFLCLVLGAPAMAAQSPSASQEASGAESDAAKVVQKAADVVHKLSTNSDTRDTLKKAKAVFIVPDYKTAAFVVGGSGGEGVLVANNNGIWSAPAFYNASGLSLGLQAGATSGSIAFFLMSDKALNEFRNRKLSLSADAGLNIVKWSASAQASSADAIAWSDTKGLYGGLAAGLSDISWDESTNQTYYNRTASADDIISGKMKAPASANTLKSEFSALERGKSSSSQQKEQR
jgi:lipid-binding SYLF domain-containing protein